MAPRAYSMSSETNRKFPVPSLVNWRWRFVAAAGPAGAPTPGGYAILMRSAAREHLAPYLITPNQIPQPAQVHWTARVNGKEFESGEIMMSLTVENTGLRPGEFRSTPCSVRSSYAPAISSKSKPNESVSSASESHNFLEIFR